ncbi:hypothetical protein ABIB87_006712 [Bradyrhizobium sp. JR18.2]
MRREGRASLSLSSPRRRGPIRRSNRFAKARSYLLTPNHSLWLWVPGSRFARPGTTVLVERQGSPKPYVGDTAPFSAAACGAAPRVSLAFSVFGHSSSRPMTPEPTMTTALMVKPVR